MNFFKIMNQKLDEGWKVTDISCTLCKGTVMVNPSLTEYFCVRCNKPVSMVQEVDESDEEDVETENQNTKKGSNQNSSSKEDSAEKIVQSNNELEKYSDYSALQNEVLSRMNRPDPSKKLGEKLLEGWIMMKEGCPDCESVPLMKSKKGEILCVACDKFFKNPNQKGSAPKTTGSKPQETPTKQKIESHPTETQSSQLHHKQQYASQFEQKPQPPSSQKTYHEQSLNTTSSYQNTSSMGQRINQDASLMSHQNQPLASSLSTNSSNINRSSEQSNSMQYNKVQREDLQFDPNFFEMNIQNYKSLMGLINKAANDLTRKIESNPVDQGMIGNIVKLIDAQTQIDRSQMELIKTIMNNS